MGDYLLVNDRAERVMGVYDTKDDALRAVADGIRHHGSAKAAHNLTLQIQRRGGKLPDEPIASGAALAKLALDRFPARKTA